MRAIKFRLWDYENLEFEYVDLNSCHPKYMSELIWTRNKFQTIWLQYTGLNDINKKEIYEGDVVETLCGNVNEIFWHSAGYWSWFENSLETGKIVGNIYENPELGKKT